MRHPLSPPAVSAPAATNFTRWRPASWSPPSRRQNC